MQHARLAIAAVFGTGFAVGLLSLAGACNGSTSTTACPVSTQLSCKGTCIDPMNDPANCGQCGITCDPASLCSHGVCASLCTNGEQACATGDGGLCTNLQSDNNHCGSCDASCQVLQVCTNGACQGGCAPSEMGCIAEAGQPFCANVMSDNNNCGACAVVCGPEQLCASGSCASSCSSVQTLCAPEGGAAYCANLQTDNTNCGTCGNMCDGLHVCAGGKCAASCLSDQTECLDSGVGDGGPYCADTVTDNANCGSCGHACPTTTPLCSMGVCVSLE